MDIKTCTSHTPYNSAGLDAIASIPAIILSCASCHDGYYITARTPEDHANKIAGLLYRRFVDDDENIELKWEMDYRLGHRLLATVDYGNNYDETFFIIDKSHVQNASDEKILSAINEHFRAIDATDSEAQDTLGMIVRNFRKAELTKTNGYLCLEMSIYNPGPDTTRSLLIPLTKI